MSKQHPLAFADGTVPPAEWLAKRKNIAQTNIHPEWHRLINLVAKKQKTTITALVREKFELKFGVPFEQHKMEIGKGWNAHAKSQLKEMFNLPAEIDMPKSGSNRHKLSGYTSFSIELNQGDAALIRKLGSVYSTPNSSVIQQLVSHALDSFAVRVATRGIK